VSDLLALARWRAETAALYAAVREAADPAAACAEMRRRRDRMFAAHPQSPLDEAQKRLFAGLSYFPYDARLRFRLPVEPGAAAARGGGAPPVELPEGTLRMRPFGVVNLPLGGTLTLYWLDGYGGGLFLPFRDLTNGEETYSGGRYLYDTIKGADMGVGAGEITIDFNFAYNPSCAYNERWVCPLAPKENRLPVRIEAGEKAFG
jgi:uncharacterized protein